MVWRYLELADYLVIAEAILQVPAETLARLNRLDLADSALNAPSAGFGDVERYTTFEAKAAVLCSRLVKNHPLPDGNKRAAFLSLLEFVSRNGKVWERSPNDPAETDAIIRGVAAGTVSEAELERWVAARTRTP
ncbi:MAG TPA: type II toxin-antitoxin system death-on-curing family toxin [Solirubrobacteraceae bacterium]|jgi:death-on-curing protein|nr:type II toxin-antitoxin system death-on-curing family toxin [Solirubrobacteraceae bacterium]